MHSIKIKRARSLAQAGRYPGTFGAMLDGIPEAVVKSLSAKRLAELIDSIWSVARASKQIALNEAARSGELWVAAGIYDVRKAA